MNLLTTRPRASATEPDVDFEPEHPTAATEPGARTRCPWCHEACFSTGAVTVCRSCYAPHHASCHRESGCCASCGAAERLEPGRAESQHTALRLACGLMATIPTFISGLLLLGFSVGVWNLIQKGGAAAGYRYSGTDGVLQHLSFIVTWGLMPGLLFGAAAFLLWAIFARGPAVLDSLTPAAVRRGVRGIFALTVVGLALSFGGLSVALGDDGLPQLIGWAVYFVLTFPALWLSQTRRSPAEELRARRRRAIKSGKGKATS